MTFQSTVYDATYDGKDSIERQLTSDNLWWLKVVDRQDQSIAEAIPLIVLSSLWQGRSEGERDWEMQGDTTEESVSYWFFSEKMKLWNILCQLCRPTLPPQRHEHLVSYLISFLFSAACPILCPLRPIVKSEKERWQKAKKKNKQVKTQEKGMIK